MSDKSSNRKYLIWLWTLFSIPFIAIIVIFILISRDKLGTMPSFEELENPEYSLAAEVYSSDGVLLGKSVSRTVHGQILMKYRLTLSMRL